jgi:transposase
MAFRHEHLVEIGLEGLPVDRAVKDERCRDPEPQLWTAKLGHEVRLIAPACVKPLVKRQKNDMADADATCEAAQRPNRRFVAVKNVAKQASVVKFRTGDVLVCLAQLIDRIRGYLSEYGLIRPQVPRRRAAGRARSRIPTRTCHGSSHLPGRARRSAPPLAGADRSTRCDIPARAEADDGARRLMTVPGIEPLIGTAIEAQAPACGDVPLGPRNHRVASDRTRMPSAVFSSQLNEVVRPLRSEDG